MSAVVLAAAAVERERLLVTANESEIEALFAGPPTFLGTPLSGIQPTKNVSQKDLHDTIRTYLNDRAKERESCLINLRAIH